MKKNVKNKIKAIRSYYGYSQIEFARILHVDQTAVSNWETGKNSIDIGTLQLISDHFKVPIEYIIGRDYVLKIDTTEWDEYNWEDYYNAPVAGRDYIKFKIGKGYFPTSAHEDETSFDSALSPNRQKLIEWAQSVPEEKIPAALQALEAILAMLK